MDLELFKLDERQELIDLLCELPWIEYARVRYSLSAGLPSDLRNNIEYTHIPRVDVESLVDMVTSETWFRLPDNRYPILIVIENAINKVRGSEFESTLKLRMNELRARLGLSALDSPGAHPPQLLLDDFSQKLDNLIDLMSPSHDQVPSLEDELRSIYQSFNRKILRRGCKAAIARLAVICAPIREFSAILEESNDLKIKVHRNWLMNALGGFENQAKAVEDSINRFSREYVVKPQQPPEKRVEIQQQLNILIDCQKSVLNTAKKLRSELKV